MSVRWKNRMISLWAILLLLMTGSVLGALDASLDRQVISETETVELTLAFEGQSSSRPDTSPLESDFDILASSGSNQLTITNGRTSARTLWTLVLSPKRQGELEIPPLEIDGQLSQRLTLKVDPASAVAVDEQADVFIESELLTESPYVQAQLLLKVKLFHAVDISQGTLSEPTAAQTLVQRLGKDRQFISYRGERRYQVFERLYALFPQASGELEIAAPVFDGQVPDHNRQRSRSGRIFGNDPFGNLFPTTRQVRVRGKPLTVEVRPQPAAARGDYWLPAAAVELTESWSQEDDSLRVGDPLTRSLSLKAVGLTAAQLPDLATKAPPGVSSYPDKAELINDTEDQRGVVGTRLQKVAYIPTQPGLLELPEVVVEWWDTENDRLQRHTLPARRLQVMPSASTQAVTSTPPAAAPTVIAVPPPPAIASEVSPVWTGHLAWPVATVLFALTWLITLLLWLRARSRLRGKAVETVQSPVEANHSAARSRLKQACRQNDPVAARTALIEWADARWPGLEPRGLEVVAGMFDGEGTRTLILQLDRHLYRGEADPWEGSALWSAVKKGAARDAAGEQPKAGPLPPLYPL